MKNSAPTLEEQQQLLNLYNQGLFAEAVENADTLIARFSEDSFCWKVLGSSLQKLGEIDKAINAKIKVVELIPSDAEAHANLGFAYCVSENNVEKASQHLHRALVLNPNLSGVHYNLAVLLQNQGNFEEAEKHYRKLLEKDSNSAEIYNNLGAVLKELGKCEEAEQSYRRVLEIDPNYVDALYNLANLLKSEKRLKEAEHAYFDILKINPNHLDTHNNLGILFKEQGEFEKAKQSYLNALNINPDFAEAHNNLGIVFKEQGQLEKAEESYLQALKIKSNFAEAHNNLGLVFQEQSHFEHAKQSYLKAVQINPDFAEAHYHYALSLLTLGQLKEGFEQYQWFYHPKNTNRHKPQQPNLTAKQWQGESLQGKTILIHAEQGFGDMIQFVRYAQNLYESGASVSVLVAKPLIDLFKTIPWIDRILEKGVENPIGYDFWVFALALPFLFQTVLENVPCNVPYLSVNSEKSAWWKNWLTQHSPTENKRVGLVWAGSSAHKNNKNRSISLEQFSVLNSLKNITWVSLQLGDQAQSDIAASPLNILDASLFIQNFVDSAVLLNNLDLLITVDSAPAHLAGALNIPVWVMITKVPDWRWLLGRSDSPWYPSMRLFRQPEIGDWTSVLTDVKLAFASKAEPNE